MREKQSRAKQPRGTKNHMLYLINQESTFNYNAIIMWSEFLPCSNLIIKKRLKIQRAKWKRTKRQTMTDNKFMIEQPEHDYKLMIGQPEHDYKLMIEQPEHDDKRW